MENGPFEDVSPILKMVIFHCHVSFRECTSFDRLTMASSVSPRGLVVLLTAWISSDGFAFNNILGSLCLWFLHRLRVLAARLSAVDTAETTVDPQFLAWGIFLSRCAPRLSVGCARSLQCLACSHREILMILVWGRMKSANRVHSRLHPW